jgi:predicted nucleic acid-binding protein
VRPIVDTGPLVALLDAREPDHAWARETFNGVRAPLYTCEACLSEAAFLLGHVKGGVNALLTLVSLGIVVPQFRLAPEIDPIHKLMTKYASVPMSLADACLVRMTELDARATVVTLDNDFRVYRRNGRQAVPVLMPER